MSDTCETGKTDYNTARNQNIAHFQIGSAKTNEHLNDASKSSSGMLMHAAPSVIELKQYLGVFICGLTLWGSSWFILRDAVAPGGRIYPVIILSKGPLSWNWEYIKYNSGKVFSLATLPWIVECLSTAVFAHVLLKYPWYWGLHLGAILSSVSPAVVVPTAMALSSRGLGTKNKVALLVANAGGLDTAFTEGMFGALLAIFVGIALGILWGILVDWLPDHKDVYAPTVRSLLIFSGGLLLSYGCGYLGWGGTSGVAIMVCGVTAATRWARQNWPINNNPVSEVYKLLWRILEPIGLDRKPANGLQFNSLRPSSCRLLAIFNRVGLLKTFANAVLVRVAADSLWKDSSNHDKQIAAQHSNIIVIAILVTSTLGSALTTFLGPVLLSQDSRVAPEGIYYF
ncbi:hypothetical protein MSG28_002164 [Choristoneura fumiferana]|uniref:Uncharacterized protein n=1 Tax=Choristoneura fumiferana TaxID=7141 RepID=A0ACC0JU83_CHOFU|nr:hypothetical protein MSG28_002164 [Choristoneura fumiferana]